MDKDYKYRCIDHPANMSKNEHNATRDVLIKYSNTKPSIDDSIIVNTIKEYNQLIDEITNIINHHMSIKDIDYNNRDTMIGDIKSKYSIFNITELKKYFDLLKIKFS
jgi:hypothetical protein